MPTPRPEQESEDEWMERCMSDDEAQEDFPERDQRAAFCSSRWEDAMSKDAGIEGAYEIEKAHPGNLSETLLAEMNDVEVRAQRLNIEALLSRVADDAEVVIREWRERGLGDAETPHVDALVGTDVQKAEHPGAWLTSFIDEMDRTNAEVIAEIAEKADVTSEAVRRWLRGDTACPGAENLQIAAEILKISDASVKERFEQTGCDYADTVLDTTPEDDDEFEKAEKSYETNLIKTDDERQIVYGVVLEPNRTDAHGDVISRDEVERAAHRFMRDKIRNARDPKEVNQDHASDMEAEIVESWVLKETRSIGEVELNAGTWLAGVHVPDPDDWELVKSGHWNGFSIEGRGKRISAP